MEYNDEAGAVRRYTPDFVIRRKDGRCLIVEIKDARWEATVKDEMTSGRAVSVEGRKALAVKRWETLNPDRLKYQIIFAADDVLPTGDLRRAEQFVSPPS